MGVKKLPIFSDKKCSDDFYYAFCHVGSTSVDCTACGRYHFAEGGEYEEGELEELKKKMREDPDKYIMYDGDLSIPWVEFADKQFVTVCPCNYAKTIEDLLLANQTDILEFFDRVTKDKLETATSENGQVEKVKTNLKRRNQS